MQAFREVVEAFKSAVYGMPDEEQEEEVETKYTVQGSTGKSITGELVLMVVVVLWEEGTDK